MPWINLARFLTILRRRGEDPRDWTIYCDDEAYTSLRRPQPRYSERLVEPLDDEAESDEGEEN